MGWHIQREAPTSGPSERYCCAYCGQPVESPPYNTRWVEYAEDQQAVEERAEHQMPPMLNIREALHWCKMLDDATDEMQELQKKGGGAELAAVSILETLALIRKWILRDSPLAEGTALPSLWELIDDEITEPWLPSVLRIMERQLRESTAVRAHYYACEAIASGSAAGARDEFMYYCEVQLNCEYNDLVHSRMLQAYHKALGDKTLFRSLSQTMKARCGHKRTARKPTVIQQEDRARDERSTAATLSHEGAEGSAVRAIYTQKRSKSG